MDDVRLYSIQVDGADLQLSNNFSLGEFASSDGTDQVLVHPWLLHGLQAIRDHFGSLVKINSGYRSLPHNKAEGGKMPDSRRNAHTGSRHLWGLAADIVVVGHEPEKVARFAEDMGFGGVGRYSTFTHVDVWSTGRRWNR